MTIQNGEFKGRIVNSVTLTDVGVPNKYTTASAISWDLSPAICLRTSSDMPASEKISVITTPGLML